MAPCKRVHAAIMQNLESAVEHHRTQLVADAQAVCNQRWLSKTWRPNHLFCAWIHIREHKELQDCGMKQYYTCLIWNLAYSAFEIRYGVLSLRCVRIWRHITEYISKSQAWRNVYEIHDFIESEKKNANNIRLWEKKKAQSSCQTSDTYLSVVHASIIHFPVNIGVKWLSPDMVQKNTILWLKSWLERWQHLNRKWQSAQFEWSQLLYPSQGLKP